MSECTTIARPYAKAIFEQALDEDKLAEWSERLQILAETVLTSEVSGFIANPVSTQEQQVELLQAVSYSTLKEDKSLNNLITLLALNKRLMLLPDIKALYEAHKAEQEKTLSVDVSSFSAVSEKQQQQMVDALSQRLKRKVSLKISIDPSLLGGAVIRAGDLVIDGSVRGKLIKLSTGLAA
jgi:F-type H+-transporting ATPase subunit delta